MNKFRQGDTIANATTCHNTSHISSRARPARRRAEHHARASPPLRHSSLVPYKPALARPGHNSGTRHTTLEPPHRPRGITGPPHNRTPLALSPSMLTLFHSRTPKGRRPESSRRRSGPGAARAESPPLRARPPPRASSRPAGWRTTCCHNAHKSPRRAEW